MRVLFCSIPKTGSSSIREWFLEKMKPNYRFYGSKRCPEEQAAFNPTDHNFMFMDFVGGHHFDYVYTQTLYDQIGKEWKDLEFTCVRNPLRRLVSSYKFYKSLNAPEDVSFIVNRTFKSFVLDREELSKRMYQTDFNHVYRLQCSFPIKNCSVILRTEDLSQDWKGFCERIGVDYFPIGHSRKSTYDPFMSYWDDEMLEHCQEWLQPDFDLLGYEYPRRAK